MYLDYIGVYQLNNEREMVVLVSASSKCEGTFKRVKDNKLYRESLMSANLPDIFDPIDYVSMIHECWLCGYTVEKCISITGYDSERIRKFYASYNQKELEDTTC